AQHQDLAELDGGADLCVEQLDAQGLALHHAVLLAASNDDCVHGNLWICWLCSYVGAAAWRTASGIEPREKQPPWVTLRKWSGRKPGRIARTGGWFKPQAAGSALRGHARAAGAYRCRTRRGALFLRPR